MFHLCIMTKLSSSPLFSYIFFSVMIVEVLLDNFLDNGTRSLVDSKLGL